MLMTFLLVDVYFVVDNDDGDDQGCIFRLTCSHAELTKCVSQFFLEPPREMP